MNLLDCKLPKLGVLSIICGLFDLVVLATVNNRLLLPEILGEMDFISVWVCVILLSISFFES